MSSSNPIPRIGCRGSSLVEQLKTGIRSYQQERIAILDLITRTSGKKEFNLNSLSYLAVYRPFYVIIYSFADS
jgi:hypothetical protein